MPKNLQPLYHAELSTPVGPLSITCSREHVRLISFTPDHLPNDTIMKAHPSVMREVIDQLSAYFDRRLQHFDLPLELSGTVFQVRVWEEMQRIEFGRVRTYKQIAENLGNRHLVRAVGGAANRNPIPIIIPCHRVVGSNGWLGGFAPGVSFKKILLEHEGALVDLS